MEEERRLRTRVMRSAETLDHLLTVVFTRQEVFGFLCFIHSLVIGMLILGTS